MIFNKHGSFYIRNSWPMKGLMAIDYEPTIFTPQNISKAIDKLGIGRAMVTSLRYWLPVLGLAEEGRDSMGRVVLNPTILGRQILEYDSYFQDIGTTWLLNSNLVKSAKEATTWYWFFNIFNRVVFTKEDFLKDLKSFTKTNGITISETSLSRDFNCLKNTYIAEPFIDLSDYIEEGIISFFSSLNLIKQESKNTYRKMPPDSNTLPSEVILYSIIDTIDEVYDCNRQSQVGIDTLYEKEGHVGKVFNLPYNLLLDKLDELENKGYLNIFSRFGHNHIEILEKDKIKILKDYYRKDL